MSVFETMPTRMKAERAFTQDLLNQNDLWRDRIADLFADSDDPFRNFTLPSDTVFEMRDDYRTLMERNLDKIGLAALGVGTAGAVGATGLAIGVPAALAGTAIGTVATTSTAIALISADMLVLGFMTALQKKLTEAQLASELLPQSRKEWAEFVKDLKDIKRVKDDDPQAELKRTIAGIPGDVRKHFDELTDTIFLRRDTPTHRRPLIPPKIRRKVKTRLRAKKEKLRDLATLGPMKRAFQQEKVTGIERRKLGRTIGKLQDIAKFRHTREAFRGRVQMEDPEDLRDIIVTASLARDTHPDANSRARVRNLMDKALSDGRTAQYSISATTRAIHEIREEDEFTGDGDQWITEQDRVVCPICRPLHNLRRVHRDADRNIIGGWEEEAPNGPGPPELGGSTHWGCRCYIAYDTRENLPVPFKDDIDTDRLSDEVMIQMLHDLRHPKPPPF